MIFEQEYVLFEILDVLYLNQACLKSYNSNRNFDAISFRYEANTIIETDNNQIELLDNSICHIPSNVNYTRISKKDKLIVIHFKAFNYHSNIVEYVNPEHSEKYSALFKEILHCWNRKDTSYKYECSALLNKIFAELYKDNEPVCKNQKIHKSILYIEKNYLRKDFSLSIAAKKSFISETYFRKLFKKEFNLSPKRYIIECRIKHAQALILTGYFTLQEISELCGYNDYKHFSTEFKKIIGVTPSTFCYNFDKKIKS